MLQLSAISYQRAAIRDGVDTDQQFSLAMIFLTADS
jgi:hypothetical protein